MSAKDALTMKAAVLSKLNAPLDVVAGIQIPELRRGQVLVKLAYSGVCHSQLMEVRGKRGADPHLPHLLGHEGTGKVVRVGEGVGKVGVGDLVVLGWIKGSGIDAGGVKYLHGAQTINAGGVTTFNEYAVVSENRLVMLPKGVPLDIGVLFGCAIPTGAGIVINELAPPPGSSVAIFGLGGIGLSALMATQLFQCSRVIAVDVAAEKLSMALRFGATEVLDARRCNPLEEIRGRTDGRGVDFAVDASGSCEVIETAFNAVRRGGGLCVFASHPEHGGTIRIDPYELICGKQIRGSWGGACNPDVDVPRFAALYATGKLPLEALLTDRYRLDQINQALDDLEMKKATRPLIEIDPSLSG